MMREYTHFAQMYDAFMEDAPYDKWVSFTRAICERYKHVPASIVDLGCGTGEIALRFAQEGFHVTGVDLSADMLTIADQKAQKMSVPLSWLHQDIRTMEVTEQVDLAVSYCDVVNYITEIDELVQMMESVHKSLRSNGLFIFDVHALNYVEQHLINHTFSDVDNDMAYIWNCFGSENTGELFHELTFFMKQHEQYERFDEDHHQRTYETSVYIDLMKKAGFANIEIFSDFQVKNEKSVNTEERIFIVGQKQSR